MQKLAEHTVYLYGRQIVVAVLNLISLRYLVQFMGVQSYADFGAISSLVLISSFAPSALNFTIQRFATHAKVQKQENAFNNIIGYGYLLYFVTVFILASIYLFISFTFLDSILNLNELTYKEARYLIGVCFLSFSLNIAYSPLVALMVADQKFKKITIISILDSITRLLCVLSLGLFDKASVALYIHLGLIHSICILIIYIVGCNEFLIFKRFVSLINNRKLSLRPITEYFILSNLGVLTSAMRNHGISLIIGRFYLPPIFVSRLISMSICNQLTLLVSSFSQALYPHIGFSQAKEDSKLLISQVSLMQSINSMLIWIIVCPFILFSNEFLKIWLATVPTGAQEILRLSLLEVLVISYGLVLSTVLRLKENIRQLEMVLGIVQIVNVICILIVAQMFADINLLLSINVFFAFLSVLIKLVLVVSVGVFSAKQVLKELLWDQKLFICCLTLLSIVIIYDVLAMMSILERIFLFVLSSWALFISKFKLSDLSRMVSSMNAVLKR